MVEVRNELEYTELDESAPGWGCRENVLSACTLTTCFGRRTEEEVEGLRGVLSDLCLSLAGLPARRAGAGGVMGLDCPAKGSGEAV